MKRLSALMLACLLLSISTGCGKNPESTAGMNEPESSAVVTAQPEDTAPAVSAEITAAKPEPQMPEYTVRPAEWADVQWTQYQCAYFTLRIPVGWEVQWDGNSEALRWQATAGDGTILGLFNADHLIAAKNEQMANLLAHDFYLENGTVEELFQKMYANTTDYFTVQNSCVPENKDYLQSLRRDKAI